MIFKEYIRLREGTESIDPHVISADPPMKLPQGIQRIADAFKKSKEVAIGKEVDSKAGGEKDVTMKSKKFYIVGGAVRDHLLGHTPRNYNLTTDAHPEEVARIMMHARPPIQVVKKEKGSVKVSVNNETYDIETMSNGKDFTANPEEDAKRRDVTVNSLYYEPSSKKIYDYTGGLRHLKDGQVKFNGKAEDSVKEDGMRKLRYARMLNKVGGKADDNTKNAITNTETDDLPPEKVREEFWKGMEDLHANPVKYLKTYKDLGLLPTVFPKLELSFDFPECKTCKSRPIVLAALLKNNKPQKLVAELRSLKYTDREIKDAVFLINLLLFKPAYVYDFKKELINTSLTKRQIMDWAKINHLNVEEIGKLVDHKFTTNPSDFKDLSGEELKDKVRDVEADAFTKN